MLLELIIDVTVGDTEATSPVGEKEQGFLSVGTVAMLLNIDHNDLPFNCLLWHT